MTERRNNPTEPGSVREPVSAVEDDTPPPSLSRRRLLKGAASTVPVVVSLASGAAVAQSSFARRVQQIATVPDATQGPGNGIAHGTSDAELALGYVDTQGDGYADNQDTVWVFRKTTDTNGDPTLCIEWASDASGNQIVSEQNYVKPPIIDATQPIAGLSDGTSNIVITASSWASLGPNDGGYCSTPRSTW